MLRDMCAGRRWDRRGGYIRCMWWVAILVRWRTGGLGISGVDVQLSKKTEESGGV